MIKADIRIKDAADIRAFNKACLSLTEADIDVVCGKMTIDGKSILGLSTLEVGRQYGMILYNTDESALERFSDFLMK